MTIDKAIEILENYLRGDEPDYAPDLPASIRLGIEALKAIKFQRENTDVLRIVKIAGETED